MDVEAKARADWAIRVLAALELLPTAARFAILNDYHDLAYERGAIAGIQECRSAIRGAPETPPHA